MSVETKVNYLRRIRRGIEETSTEVEGRIVHISEADETTGWIDVDGGIYECRLRSNQLVEFGDSIWVTKDPAAPGRYRMADFKEAGGMGGGGLFPDQGNDSPFGIPDPATGQIPGGDTPASGETVAPGTTVVDRRPDTVFAVDETPVPADSPVPPQPPDGVGPSRGTRPAPKFPKGYEPPRLPPPGDAEDFPGVGGNVQKILSTQVASGRDLRASRADHQHPHDDLPVSLWPLGREPHQGYAWSDHTHGTDPGDPGNENTVILYREKIVVPNNDTTKTFSTSYRFRPYSLLVFLNGLAQMFDDEVTEDVGQQSFTFANDVVIDGTGSEPDVILVYYVPADTLSLTSGWGQGPWGTMEWGA